MGGWGEGVGSSRRRWWERAKKKEEEKRSREARSTVRERKMKSHGRRLGGKGGQIRIW